MRLRDQGDEIWRAVSVCEWCMCTRVHKRAEVPVDSVINISEWSEGDGFIRGVRGAPELIGAAQQCTAGQP